MTHAALVGLVALVLLAVGQPIFTDDVWWHLGIGAHYVAEGPWLDADPFLFAASGPPDPAAWLADVGLYAIERAVGFQGLRVAHVLLVAGILGLAWSTLRRVGGSALFASLGLAVFAVFSAYRLFQLRPHLLTILLALLLVRLLVVDRKTPTARRIGLGAFVMWLWANTHGGFVLGPVLLAAAIGGIALWEIARGAGFSLEDPAWRRARALALALVAGLLATLVNPLGPEVHGLYFAAGAETPDLGVVGDEWARVGLLSAPLRNLPPTPLVWGLAWLLLLATPAVVAWAARRPVDDGPSVDPALVAIAAVSLVGMLSAVRLLWMAFFPLLALASALPVLRARAPTAPGVHAAARLAAVAAALALLPAFVAIGDWPMISRGVQRDRYAQPFAATKYFAHAVWFLRDSGLEGRLFNEYSMGNFLGYWLAPNLKTFINGSLNVPKQTMSDGLAIVAGGGAEPGASARELLDRHGVDVFLGTGMPRLGRAGRASTSTTAHLDGLPGWRPVFRNLVSAVYLKDAERNRPNLERVAAYYAREGVPFDPERGFEPLRVAAEAPEWAVTHGVIPADYSRSAEIAESGRRGQILAARARLASISALLGEYDEAAALDRLVLAVEPERILAARRLVWSLLHAGRAAEARRAADRLATVAPPTDTLSRAVVDAAREFEAASPARRASILATLPVFTRPQGRVVLAGFMEPAPRPAPN